MSYFLRIKEKPKGKYIAIYDSSYSPVKKYNISKIYKNLGYESDLITDEIKDPISFYREMCNDLNQKKSSEKESTRQLITEVSPLKNVGYFLGETYFDKINISNEFNLMSKLFSNHKADYYKIFKHLVLARMFDPQSKSKTYFDVLPSMYGFDIDYSKDDFDNCLEYIGTYYREIISTIKHGMESFYKFDTEYTLFDCTNFYFEIDREFEDKKKGPSKENFKGPIIGMALLLDKQAMPLSMRMYPGNQSEKPEIRNIIDTMKMENQIKGRSIQIADKGLNCARNIYYCLKNKDGYIFSKSVLSSSAIEKRWFDNENNKYYEVCDSKGNLKYKYKSCVDEFEYKFEEDEKKYSFKVKEKRILTFNPSLREKKIFELQKIEAKLKDLIACKAKKEMFKTYSSYVDAIAFDKEGELIDAQINYVIKQEKFEEEKKYAGYNLLISSEINNECKEIYNAYHQLWKIEQSFRIMKTYLDGRPVYVRKKERIYGHFLVVYYSTVLLRCIEFLGLKSEFSIDEIINFIRDYNVVDLDNGTYFNVLKCDESNKALIKKLPLVISYKYPTYKDLLALKKWR
ncbi:MAG: IS1634 family transposase [Bacilli bacterium]